MNELDRRIIKANRQGKLTLIGLTIVVVGFGIVAGLALWFVPA